MNNPGMFYSTHSFYPPYYACPEGKCCASAFSAAWAFISQSALIGSELWLAAMCKDLELAYTSPFSSAQANKRWFLAIVSVVSLIFGFVLIFTLEPYDIGPSAAYVK